MILSAWILYNITEDAEGRLVAMSRFGYKSSSYRPTDILVEVHKTTYDTEARPKGICEKLYEEWNNGSGSESHAFKAAHVRSMSKGDMVLLAQGNGTFAGYVCESMGFEPTVEPITYIERPSIVPNLHWPPTVRMIAAPPVSLEEDLERG